MNEPSPTSGLPQSVNAKWNPGELIGLYLFALYAPFFGLIVALIGMFSGDRKKRQAKVLLTVSLVWLGIIVCCRIDAPHLLVNTLIGPSMADLESDNNRDMRERIMAGINIRVARDGKIIGTYKQAELYALIQNGTLKKTDSVWFEELTNWIRLDDGLAFFGPVAKHFPILGSTVGDKTNR